MKKKSLIPMFGIACIVGGVFAQAFNISLFDSETEMGTQKADFNSLSNNEQGLESKLSEQMLSNKTQIYQVAQQLSHLKETLNQLTLTKENEQVNIPLPDAEEEDIITGVTVEDPVEDRQFIDHFASYLTNEVSSSDDDQESTSKIEQSFETELESRKITGVSLLSSECKATLCKIELGFDDEVTRERYSNIGNSIIPWDGQAFYHQSESEPNTMIYYVAKEGFDLAMPES
jgi:hypothetical protein